MRLVVDQIRGRPVNEALAILQFSAKRASEQIDKTLRSAVANARAKSELAGEPVSRPGPTKVEMATMRHKPHPATARPIGHL
jgi:hypothetical protein